jgi:hypothetical protein
MSTPMPPPSPPPAYSGWAPPVSPRNGQGTAALVIGAAACAASVTVILFFVGGPLGVVGLILGILALGRVRRGEATNRGVAITAVVLNALAVLISGVLLILAIVGVAMFADVHEEATQQVTAEPTSDAAAEGWADLPVTPGSDDAVDGPLAVAAWALPGITKDDWPKQRVVTEAGNVAAAVQAGAEPQSVIADLTAQGLSQTTATWFATLAVEAYCTDSAASAFVAAVT